MLCVDGSAIRPSRAAASIRSIQTLRDESELVLNFNTLQTAAGCYLLDQRGLRGRTNTYCRSRSKRVSIFKMNMIQLHLLPPAVQ